ncbi:MBL fold metallo-hydrolase [Trichocoleus sp. FACHB-262]|uniref:MBL fold metallo-hydrolase n=1 Tax=Trichocoleus sp. FACHB-262 TaxID=2692869 RepID=UPI001683C4A3|nr:MBL fold metallo-hydrolase [Trichocoleus sp. FACHB-262]MBD2119899.1 MBL fold metallo-hydrolase [Trichocoleus sp. FACHB-262]
MKIHHLNCATQCILGGALVGGKGSLFHRVPIVSHCLLIETEAGLVLVDTGLGLQDIAQPQQRLSSGFLFLAGPQLIPEETAVYQVEQLGFSRHDVRHIILTHLDLDHAGGIADFPQAKVHLLDAEYRAATHSKSRRDRYRYRPLQWQHEPDWVRYQVQGDRWFGFECIQQLTGLPPEILLVPLLGHTHGHTGVAIQTPTGWLLHAGDAYYFHQEMHPTHPHCPFGLAVVQRVGAVNNLARLQNQERLRQLKQQQAGTVEIICAHDPMELRGRRKEEG